MPRFRIRFLKTVANDSGHEAKICQRQMEVETDNMDQAMAQVRDRFCALEGVPDWCLHAEAIEIEATREPQRSPGAAVGAKSAGTGRKASPIPATTRPRSI